MAIVYSWRERKIRIIFVTHQFSRTGAPLYLCDLVRTLSLHSATCFIIGPPDGPLLARVKGVEGVTTITSHLIPLLYLSSRSCLQKILYMPIRVFVNCLLSVVLLIMFLRIKPDMIHLNSLASRFAALAAKASRRKVVWHLHEYGDYGGWPRLLQSAFVRFCADTVIANSNATADWWFHRKRPRRLTVIYNLMPLYDGEIFQFEKRLFDVIYIGRLTREKGLEDLISAIHIVHLKQIYLRLLIVGNWEDYSYRSYVLQLISENGLTDGIEIREDVHNPQDLIAQSRVLALPSYREGFGRVILESFACRVPVVATAVGGIPEIIKHETNGLLSKPGDREGLATNLVRLCRDANLNACFGESGYQFAMQKFGPAAFEKAIRQLYTEPQI